VDSFGRFDRQHSSSSSNEILGFCKVEGRTRTANVAGGVGESAFGNQGSSSREIDTVRPGLRHRTQTRGSSVRHANFPDRAAASGARIHCGVLCRVQARGVVELIWAASTSHLSPQSHNQQQTNAHYSSRWQLRHDCSSSRSMIPLTRIFSDHKTHFTLDSRRSKEQLATEIERLQQARLTLGEKLVIQQSASSPSLNGRGEERVSLAMHVQVQHESWWSFTIPLTFLNQ
jgi:hypothetical protein